MIETRVPEEEIAEAAMLWAVGVTYREIAREFGRVTYETWRQLILDRFPGIWEIKREWREVVRRSRALDFANAPPCVACWGPVPKSRRNRPGANTCGDECSALRDVANVRLRNEHDPDAHRRATAKWDLAHPDHPKVTPAVADLARRILSEDPPPPNRTFVVPGSAASAAYATILERRRAMIDSGRARRTS